MSGFAGWYWKFRQLNYFRSHKGEALIALFLILLRWLWLAFWHSLKRPRLLAVEVLTALAWYQWGWKAGAIALPCSILLVTAVWIALLAERGTARGVSPILTGVSRLVGMRRRLPDACIRVGLKYEQKAVPTSNWRITQHGLTVDLSMGALGKDEKDALLYASALKSSLYVDRIRAKRVHSGVARLYIEWGEHLAGRLSLSDIPESTRPGFLSIGIREDGSPLELPIGRSVLACGLTGAGKSSFVWALVYALIKQGYPFRLRIGDPKFVEWKIALDSIDDSPIVYRYTNSPAQLGERGLNKDGFMWEIERDLTERLKNIPTGVRLHTATDAEPLEIIIIDETLPLADALRKKKEQHPLALVTYQGRAAGEWAVFLSQTAEKDVIGPTRDLVPIRMAFALPNREQTEMCLGTGAVAKGACPHLLDPIEDAGVCYVNTDKGEYYAGRVGFATDADTEFLVMGELPPERTFGGGADTGRPCYVYWYYGPDENGDIELKYVGKAFDWEKRWGEHERREPDMMKECVRELTRTELWPCENDALIEERRQIQKLHPKWNKQYNDGYYRGTDTVFTTVMEDEPW